MSVTARPYTPADRTACIALFHSNVPRYFHADELSDYTEFLEQDSKHYLVLISHDEIVGCGGHTLSEDGRIANLCWGMVRQDMHHKRLGTHLLMARLHAIATTTSVQWVRLATSQHTQGFYRRFGFQVVHIHPNGCAPGLDEVEMRLALTEIVKSDSLGF